MNLVHVSVNDLLLTGRASLLFDCTLQHNMSDQLDFPMTMHIIPLQTAMA